jgi:hypothetical protein
MERCCKCNPQLFNKTRKKTAIKSRFQQMNLPVEIAQYGVMDVEQSTVAEWNAAGYSPWTLYSLEIFTIWMVSHMTDDV